MAHVYIFAQQVLNIVRSGKTEIEIPAGARISSAAADLIKEHHIQIRTVAPGMVTSNKTISVADKPTETANEAGTENQIDYPSENIKAKTSPAKSAEISEDELEEIVNRVVERVKQLKATTRNKTSAAKAVQPAAAEAAASDGDDLIICRCEEITRGEIKDAIRNGIETLNGIKRITRAGMGLCQGQTCQTLVARILTEELGLSAAEIDPTTARGPVRPLRLEVFANS